MSMIYGYKENKRLPVNAQVAGEELARIRKENGDFFSPAAVVIASRPKKAPLHSVFEWNDSVAAEQFREYQASYLIRAVTVIMPELPDSAPVRAFVSVIINDQRRYTSIAAAMTDENLRDQLLGDALREMQQFERKYAELSELASVIQSMSATRLRIIKRAA